MWHNLPGPGDFDPPDDYYEEDEEEGVEDEEPDYDDDVGYDNPADDYIMTEAEKRGQL